MGLPSLTFVDLMCFSGEKPLSVSRACVAFEQRLGRRHAGHGTIAKLPVGSGTSSKYISVVCIDEWHSQHDR